MANPASLDHLARIWARELEDGECARSSVALPVARVALARRIGLPPGTLEGLRRGRTKSLSLLCFERIRDAYRAECERQLRKLEHEIAITRTIAGDDSAAIRSAVALVDQIKSDRRG